MEGVDGPELDTCPHLCLRPSPVSLFAFSKLLNTNFLLQFHLLFFPTSLFKSNISWSHVFVVLFVSVCPAPSPLYFFCLCACVLLKFRAEVRRRLKDRVAELPVVGLPVVSLSIFVVPGDKKDGFGDGRGCGGFLSQWDTRKGGGDADQTVWREGVRRWTDHTGNRCDWRWGKEEDEEEEVACRGRVQRCCTPSVVFVFS